MRTEIISDHAARLARVRLESLLINTTAVPVPADIAPATEHPTSLGAEQTTPSDTTQAVPSEVSRPDADHSGFAASTQSTFDATSEDALSRSLQDAGNALHQSLRPDLYHENSLLETSSIARDPDQAMPFSARHESDAALASSIVGESHASQVAHGALSGSFEPPSMLPTPVAATDHAPLETAGIADGGLDHALENGVSLMHPAGAPLAAAASALAISLPSPGDGPTASTLSSLPTLPVEPAFKVVTDSITVPSLEGAGFDALAGMLQPSPAPPEAAHAVATVQASFDHESVFVPIGLEHVFHPDSEVAHPLHAGLPPVGSGLI